jgi:hypothetical protein
VSGFAVNDGVLRFWLFGSNDGLVVALPDPDEESRFRYHFGIYLLVGKYLGPRGDRNTEKSTPSRPLLKKIDRSSLFASGVRTWRHT